MPRNSVKCLFSEFPSLPCPVTYGDRESLAPPNAGKQPPLSRSISDREMSHAHCRGVSLRGFGERVREDTNDC